MLFARLVLGLKALVYLGLGLAYWFRPYEMANLNGMLLMETASVSNVRVYYGGLQLGLVVFLAWAIRSSVVERLRAALMLLLIVESALAIALCLSLWLDGDAIDGVDISALAYRVASAALSALALWHLSRQRRDRHAPGAADRARKPGEHSTAA
jgi:hypothetical protein